MKRIICFFLSMALSAPAFAADTVVARVNGVVISSQELEQEVDELIPRSTYHGNMSEGSRDGYKDKALENLINRELWRQFALSQGMKPDQKQVKARMGQIRDGFKTKKEYRAALEQSGLTEDQLRLQVEKALLVQDALDKTVTGPARMSDEALKNYYDKNIEKFRKLEEVRLSLISTKNENKAREALALIKDGEDFGVVAYRMSEDNFRVMNGDIGYIHRGRLLPEIDAVAFSLKIGEMSGLIRAESEGMWFVIRVEDKRAERLMTFNESRDSLKKELEEKRTRELFEQSIAGLKSKAAIEIIGNNKVE